MERFGISLADYGLPARTRTTEEWARELEDQRRIEQGHQANCESSAREFERRLCESGADAEAVRTAYTRGGGEGATRPIGSHDDACEEVMGIAPECKPSCLRTRLEAREKAAYVALAAAEQEPRLQPPVPQIAKVIDFIADKAAQFSAAEHLSRDHRAAIREALKRYFIEQQLSPEALRSLLRSFTPDYLEDPYDRQFRLHLAQTAGENAFPFDYVRFAVGEARKMVRDINDGDSVGSSYTDREGIEL